MKGTDMRWLVIHAEKYETSFDGFSTKEAAEKDYQQKLAEIHRNDGTYNDSRDNCTYLSLVEEHACFVNPWLVKR